MNSKRENPSQKTALSELSDQFDSLSLDSSKNSPTAKRGTLNNPMLGPSTQRLRGSTRSTHSLHKPDSKPSSLRSSRSLKGFVTSVKSSLPVGPKSAELLYKEHLFQTFQSMKFIRQLPPLDNGLLRSKQLDLPRRPGYENKKTVVFDLDETLVHCLEDRSLPSETKLNLRFPNGMQVQAGINIRPFARECLAEASRDFEVIVFTASHQCYADAVLDYLDPEHQLIHHRLYRDNCIPIQGVLLKDLRVLVGRNLSDIVIIDNAAYSFGYQLDNGIPIISWHDDYNDRELYNLIDYLKMLVTVEDVREINRQTFRLRTFYEDYLNEFVVNNKP